MKDFEVIRAVSNTETFSPRSENTAKSFENKKGTVRDVSKRLGTYSTHGFWQAQATKCTEIESQLAANSMQIPCDSTHTSKTSVALHVGLTKSYLGLYSREEACS